jgi:LysM domain
MTAITLTAPQRMRPARPVARLPHGASSARPRPVRAAGHAGTSRRAEARPRPLRLTRRGRLAITGLFTACGVGLTLWTGSVSLAGTQTQQVPVRYVSVAPGDTLWTIAGEVAPGQDRRDTIHRIVELNALPSAELAVGQRVAVPAGR